MFPDIIVLQPKKYNKPSVDNGEMLVQIQGATAILSTSRKKKKKTPPVRKTRKSWGV